MPSSSSNTSEPKMEEMIRKIIDYKKLEVMDIVRSGALFGVFLVLLLKSTGGRSRGGSLFAIGDVLGMAICGLACYFFPASYLGYQVEGKLDFLHDLQVQACGAILLSLAWTRYRSRDSRDAYCTVSFSIIRLLASALLLVTMLHAQFSIKGDKKMKQQHMSFAIFGCGLWLISHVIQLYQYNGEGKRAFGSLGGNRRDVHLLIHAVLLICASLFHLGCMDKAFLNQWFEGKFVVDDIHIHLIKLNAVLQFALGLQCLAALNYSSDDDKRNTFYGSLLITSLVVPILVLYQLKHGLYPSFAHVFFTPAVFAINALMGACDGADCSWCSWCPCFSMFRGSSKKTK